MYFKPNTSIKSLHIEGERLYYSKRHPEGHPVRPSTWSAYNHRGPIRAGSRVDWKPNGYKAYENEPMSDPRPRHRFYVSAEGTGEPEAPPPAEKPRPGHGTVYVRQLEANQWWASWQDESRQDDLEATKEEVIRWATSRPSREALVYSPEQDDYLPLNSST